VIIDKDNEANERAEKNDKVEKDRGHDD